MRVGLCCHCVQDGGVKAKRPRSDGASEQHDVLGTNAVGAAPANGSCSSAGVKVCCVRPTLCAWRGQRQRRSID